MTTEVQNIAHGGSDSLRREMAVMFAADIRSAQGPASDPGKGASIAITSTEQPVQKVVYSAPPAMKWSRFFRAVAEEFSRTEESGADSSRSSDKGSKAHYRCPPGDECPICMDGPGNHTNLQYEGEPIAYTPKGKSYYIKGVRCLRCNERLTGDNYLDHAPDENGMSPCALQKHP